MLTAISPSATRPMRLEDLRSKLHQDDQIEATMETVLNHSGAGARPSCPTISPPGWTRSCCIPGWGCRFSFGVMYLLFQAIFMLGKPLQDGVPGCSACPRRRAGTAAANAPAPVHGLLLDGIYNGVGTVAAFVPIIMLFFLFMAAGGRQRLPVARGLPDGCADGQTGPGWPQLRHDADGFRLQRAGADGHARDALAQPAPADHAGDPVLAVFGAPAGVRLHHRRAVLAPDMRRWCCSACTCSASPPLSSPPCCSSGAISNNEPFILELPPYRLPTWRQIVLRGWHEVRHFLQPRQQIHHRRRGAGMGCSPISRLVPPPAGSDTWAGMIGTFHAPVLSTRSASTSNWPSR